MRRCACTCSMRRHADTWCTCDLGGCSGAAGHRAEAAGAAHQGEGEGRGGGCAGHGPVHGRVNAVVTQGSAASAAGYTVQRLPPAASTVRIPHARQAAQQRSYGSARRMSSSRQIALASLSCAMRAPESALRWSLAQVHAHPPEVTAPAEQQPHTEPCWLADLNSRCCIHDMNMRLLVIEREVPQRPRQSDLKLQDKWLRISASSSNHPVRMPGRLHPRRRGPAAVRRPQAPAACRRTLSKMSPAELFHGGGNLSCVSGTRGSPHLHPAVIDVAAPVEGHVANVLCEAELRNALPHQLRSVLPRGKQWPVSKRAAGVPAAARRRRTQSAERGQAATLLAPPPPLSFALISAVSVEAAASVLPTWSSITWTAGTPHPHGGSPRPLPCCTGSGATAPAHRCGCSSGRLLAAGALAGPPPAPTHAHRQWVAATRVPHRAAHTGAEAHLAPDALMPLLRPLLPRGLLCVYEEAASTWCGGPLSFGAALQRSGRGAGRQCGPAGRVRLPCRRQGPVQNCMPWPRLLTAAAAPWHSPPANGGIPPSSPRTAGGPAATLADDEGQVQGLDPAPVGTSRRSVVQCPPAR